MAEEPALSLIEDARSLCPSKLLFIDLLEEGVSALSTF
jgi:hypothetical protein